MRKEYYAHSLKGRPKEEWQKLEEHLKNVADLAKNFADAFSAGEWAYAHGRWKFAKRMRVMLTCRQFVDNRSWNAIKAKLIEGGGILKCPKKSDS